MDIPYYYWVLAAGLLLILLLILLRKHLITLKRIKGFEKRQQFWLQHRNTLTGNFVTTYHEPIEDTYILDKESALLGRGGYGIVVLGVHKVSNIQYAIKFMNKDAMEKKNSKINRLEREYKLLKDIDHANIVRLFSVYDSEYEVGFVMELCSGGHLGHWLENIKYEPMKIPSERSIKSIMRQLLSAVAHMHTRGICHRDIKLQNILLENTKQNSQIKLCDFGLGTRFIGALPLKTHCGTLYSTAPEVIRESYDERCDIWSCGVVAYTLLSGRKPFEVLKIQPGGETAAAKSSITASILMGRFHFKSREWHKRSRSSRDFVKLMMTQDYRVRWYAQEAMEHGWFQDNDPEINIAIMSPQASEDELDGSRTRSLSEDISDPLQNNSAVSSNIQPLLENIKRQAESSVLHQASRLAVAYNMPQSQATDKRRQIFQSFDEDNNGSLSRQEFRKAFKEFGALSMRVEDESTSKIAKESTNESTRQRDGQILNLSEMDIDKVFDAVDVNGDNQISFTEFLAATLDPRDFDTMAINTAFGILDVDKKGYITADDMERVMAVTATARGRRRNSHHGTGGPLFPGERSSPSNSVKASKSKDNTSAPIVRRHHSFTLGVKGGCRKQSIFNYSKKSLSPVHSAVNGDSDSVRNNVSSNDISSSKEKVNFKNLGESIEKSNESDADDCEDDIEKQLPLEKPVVDNRPGVQRPRSLSTMSIGDFLRRPSLLAKNRQLEDLIRERRSSSAFSIVNSFRPNFATVAPSPSYVEEGEYSHSDTLDKAPNVRGKYDAADGLHKCDEDENSDEILKPTEFSLRAMSSPNMLGHSNSFGRGSILRRENSNEENNLMDIDDRTLEQINRAIKLCDRNNTGVISYTDFLMAMTGNKYDDAASGSVSVVTSRRNSTTQSVSASSDRIVPNLSMSEDQDDNLDVQC